MTGPVPPPRVTAVRVHPVELVHDPPLVTGAGVRRGREGMLVELVDETGRSGWGEASPLPGWGDPVDVTRRALGEVTPDGVGEALGPAGSLTRHRFARAGIDVAWHDLTARRAGVPLWLHLGGVTPRVAVNALVDAADPEAAGEAAARAVAAGHTWVKVKVGAAPAPVDVARVRAVRAAAGDAVGLRLDANRAWDLDTAVGVLGAVADLHVSYCEEPVAAPGAFAEVARRTGIPVALDETLSDAEAAARVDELVDAGGIAAIVCKPQPLGGVTPTLALATWARARGLEVVISAFLDTAVGVTAAAHLAA
ncbi:MAG: o-succinylbenzoate synthase, partial [Actinomyces sp.]